MSTTPMLQQYRKIKEGYRQHVLFFQVGDFYEMFFEDAKEIAPVLGLTLTSRHGIPMCGFPMRAARRYVELLIEQGKKVVLCDQGAAEGDAKKILDRRVTEIITPGMISDPDFLNPQGNNYLGAVCLQDDMLCFAWVDISTGHLGVQVSRPVVLHDQLRQDFERISIRELLCQESLCHEYAQVTQLLEERELSMNLIPDWEFHLQRAFDKLCAHFHTTNLRAFGIAPNDPHLYPLGVLFDYLADNQYASLAHITNIQIFQSDRYLLLDEATQKNLELVRSAHNKTKHYSLFASLNHCCTPMGSRLLQAWILAPLRKKTDILQRQHRTRFFVEHQQLLTEIRGSLGQVMDIERLSSRVSMGKAHPKDMYSLAESVKSALQILSTLAESSMEWHGVAGAEQESLAGFSHHLLQSLHSPAQMSEGNIFSRGYHADIDTQRDLLQHGTAFVEKLFKEEQQQSQIMSLRIKYNRMLGHFFEVAPSQKDLMPDHFLLRQTTRNALRYTTEALLQLDTDISNAQEQLVQLEQELFIALRRQYQDLLPALMSLGHSIAEIDVLQAFAWAATIHVYRCPEISEERRLEIWQGRHPIVEQHMPDFIPNSLELHPERGMFALVTGPNMSGKSTFLRQVAIIILMAQIGSYVPAEKAVIGCVDRLYCRVGSSDNIARGESTFLTEMNETAHILRTATDKSLVIFDEVGRGTSTLDGLAIAWAICEFTLTKLQSRTLFATHYTELTKIMHPRLLFLTLDARRQGDDIIFLRKVISGITNSFYGIDVARLAGVPEPVISRARELHARLRVSSHHEAEKPPRDLPVAENPLKKKILAEPIEALTPLAALNFLADLQRDLQESSEN